MADGEPTLGEVIRRLDAVSLQLTTLAAQMAQDRRDAAQTYVSRELYNARHEVIRRDVDELKQENEERNKTDAATRRQILFLVLGAVLTAVCSLIVATYLASGGLSP